MDSAIKWIVFWSCITCRWKTNGKAAHSAKLDVEQAVNAAHEAFKTWSQTSKTERSIILNKIADRIEANLEYIASVETLDNGKAR